MQRSWYRNGYLLHVGTATIGTGMVSAGRRAVAGFLAVVSISLSSVNAPVFPPLQLGDDSGAGFSSEQEALQAGTDAANRVVDDLMG